jgi:hypothetical protein
LVFGRWYLVVGIWLLVFGCWYLVVGIWSLVGLSILIAILLFFVDLFFVDLKQIKINYELRFCFFEV